MAIQLQQYDLSSAQRRYAEWIIEIEANRKPPTQRALAAELGFDRHTLTSWKKLPDFMDYRRDLLQGKGEDMVPKAMNVLDKLLDSKDVRTQERAARDIIERWSPATSYINMASMVDFYKMLEKSNKKPLLIESGESMLALPSSTKGKPGDNDISVADISTPSVT